MSFETEETQENGSPDLDAELNEILDNQDKEEDETDAPETETPEAEPSEEKKEEDEEKPEESPKEDETTEKPAFEAPKSWSKDERKVFDALPEEAKAAIIRREEALSPLVSRFDRERQLGKEYQELLEPYRGQFNNFQNGLPTQELKGVLEGLRALKTGDNATKLDILGQLADAHDVDFRPWLAPAQDPQNNVAPTQNPPYDVRQALAPLMQEINALKSARQTETAQREQYVQAVAENEIVGMLNNADGYPFIREVALQMASLVEQGGYTPQQAYETAVYSSPALRERLIDAKVNAKLTEQQNLQQQKTEKAQKLTGAFVDGKTGGQMPKNATLDEELNAILEAFA